MLRQEYCLSVCFPSVDHNLRVNGCKDPAHVSVQSCR